MAEYKIPGKDYCPLKTGEEEDCLGCNPCNFKGKIDLFSLYKRQDRGFVAENKVSEPIREIPIEV